MLTLGKQYRPYGTLEAITSLDGERYYFFMARCGVVSMMPAMIMEPMYEAKREEGENGSSL